MAQLWCARDDSLCLQMLWRSTRPYLMVLAWLLRLPYFNKHLHSICFMKASRGSSSSTGRYWARFFKSRNFLRLIIRFGAGACDSSSSTKSFLFSIITPYSSPSNPSESISIYYPIRRHFSYNFRYSRSFTFYFYTSVNWSPSSKTLSRICLGRSSWNSAFLYFSSSL